MSGYLYYNGFRGSAEVSAEDGCLYGKVLGIGSLVNYEGGTPEELRRAFCEAVDDYLRVCTELGHPPGS